MEYKSENINELAKALAKAQGEMKFAIKDSVNPHFKSNYADLSSVIAAIKEPLSNNGLTYLQPIVTIDGQTYIETLLIHESGQWIKSLVPLHIPKDSRNAIQAFGAACTYLRRYSLSSLVGVAQDDDDGETAQAVKPQAQPKIEYINKEQYEKINNILKNSDDNVRNEFWTIMEKGKISSLVNLPKDRYEGAIKYLLELIEKHEGGDKDGE